MTAEVSAVSNDLQVVTSKKTEQSDTTKPATEQELASVFSNNKEEDARCALDEKDYPYYYGGNKDKKDYKYSVADGPIDEVKDFTKYIATGAVGGTIEIAGFATKLAVAIPIAVTGKLVSGASKVVSFVGEGIKSLFDSEDDQQMPVEYE